MIFTIFSVFYVLIAAAMIVLILMQRGDGANAGASFGGGSSGTVFGARGAASFLTRTTAVLATLFFILTIGMGMYLSHHGVSPNVQQELGVMAGAGKSAPPATSATAAGGPGGEAPASAAGYHAQAPASSTAGNSANAEVPAAPNSANAEVPAAPNASAPAASKPAASSGPPASH